MLRHLALLTALLGLLAGDVGALVAVAAGIGRDCSCVEASSTSCCAAVVEEPSCCVEDDGLGIPEGTPVLTAPCSCGAHAPLPTVVGGGPSVPVSEESPGLEAVDGEHPRPLEDQVAERPAPAPESPPPRA